MDDRRVVAFLRAFVVLVAIAGVVMFIVGWFKNATDAPPMLGLIIIGILFSVLGIRFPSLSSFKADDPERPLKKEEEEKKSDV